MNPTLSISALTDQTRQSSLDLMLRRRHKTKRRPRYSSRSALSGSILAALRAGR
jgi:hypothetical protein